MSDIIGFWIGYGLSFFIQFAVWCGIIYLLFKSLSRQIRFLPDKRVLKFLYIPLIFFVIKMSQGVFFFKWNSCQFIWGSCIILLFTAADLFLKRKQQEKSRIWWEELGNFDYMLIGFATGLAFYTSLFMIMDLFTGWEIILLIFPIIWFVFLGCLQTRNEHYRQNGSRDAAIPEKESKCFLVFFCKLMTVFSCMVTLAVQFMKPFSLGLLLFDAIILVVAVIVPLYAKLNKKIKCAGVGYGLLFLLSVIMNFIYSNEALLVLRAIGGYVGALPNFA